MISTRHKTILILMIILLIILLPRLIISLLQKDLLIDSEKYLTYEFIKDIQLLVFTVPIIWTIFISEIIEKSIKENTFSYIAFYSFIIFGSLIIISSIIYIIYLVNNMFTYESILLNVYIVTCSITLIILKKLKSIINK